ncbi:cyclodeaminase [Halobacillus fulvus]|nr:cyclodeaminase [Halobacillus fulvus]
MFVYSLEEIKKVIQLDGNLMQQIEKAFLSLYEKQVQMPPIMRIDIPDQRGEVDIKSAYIEGEDSFAVKLSSGFFNNPSKGLPSSGGLMILMDATNGQPKAVLADDGHLTDLRTAAAGAVAAKWCSRKNSRIAGVIGTGAQARLQLEALTHVRSIEHVYVWGRNDQKSEAYKHDVERMLQIPVTVADSVQKVVETSDIVVTTTPSTTPLVFGEWLKKGTHITAMGSDAEHKQELDESVLLQADILICDKKDQSLRLGELRSCLDERVRDRAIELGSVVSGQYAGRVDDHQITVCDLTGTGVQDTAIARHVYQLLNSRIHSENGY